MRKLCGVLLVAGLVLVGCGGDDGPPKLEGPATLTSVKECIDKTGLFEDVTAEKDPIFDPAEYDLEGEKSRLPSTVRGFYKGGTSRSSQMSIDFYDTEEEAATMTNFDPATNKIMGQIEVLADTPTLSITYARKMPDDGVAALKICTHEDY